MGLLSLIPERLISSLEESKKVGLRSHEVVLHTETDSGDGGKPKMRFELVDAMNGRLLKVCTYKFNPHGPDWTSEIYIMREDESVGDAVNTLMVMKGN